MCLPSFEKCSWEMEQTPRVVSKGGLSPFTYSALWWWLRKGIKALMKPEHSTKMISTARSWLRIRSLKGKKKSRDWSLILPGWFRQPRPSDTKQNWGLELNPAAAAVGVDRVRLFKNLAEKKVDPDRAPAFLRLRGFLWDMDFQYEIRKSWSQYLSLAMLDPGPPADCTHLQGILLTLPPLLYTCRRMDISPSNYRQDWR